MDSLIIKPHTCIGKINLGMSRDQVHELMGSNFTTTKSGNIIRDRYYDFCFQIEYINNSVNYIEISNYYAYQAVFEGIDVFKTTTTRLIAYLEQYSKYLNTPNSKLGFMYVFEDIGMTLYRSNVFREETMKEPWFQELSQEQKDEELKFLYFESVAIWSKGYYDSINLFV